MTHDIRRSIRLQGYEYTQQGAYFVTVCTYAHTCRFGAGVDGEMALNHLGRLVAQEWENTAVLRPNVERDAFVMMPNHVHGIIVIVSEGGGKDARRGMVHHAPASPRAFSQPIAHSLGTIVGAFKASVTRSARQASLIREAPLWQRNYYEHIVCDQSDLDRIRNYIAGNPARWTEDALFSVVRDGDGS
jgi:REP element-mobilizing transposase RayT